MPERISGELGVLGNGLGYPEGSTVYVHVGRWVDPETPKPLADLSSVETVWVPASVFMPGKSGGLFVADGAVLDGGVAGANVKATLWVGDPAVGWRQVDSATRKTGQDGIAAFSIRSGSHVERVRISAEVLDNPVNPWCKPRIEDPYDSLLLWPAKAGDDSIPRTEYRLDVPVQLESMPLQHAVAVTDFGDFGSYARGGATRARAAASLDLDRFRERVASRSEAARAWAAPAVRNVLRSSRAGASRAPDAERAAASARMASAANQRNVRTAGASSDEARRTSVVRPANPSRSAGDPGVANDGRSNGSSTGRPPGSASSSAVRRAASASGVQPQGSQRAADPSKVAAAAAAALRARAVTRVEGESLAPKVSAGPFSVQDMAPFGAGWSGGRQLLWRAPDPVDTPIRNWPAMTIMVAVPDAGNYGVTVRHTQAPDYGDVRVFLNGKPLGDFSGYAPGVRAARADVGTMKLDQGSQQLVLTVIRRAAPSKASFVGLDAIELTRPAGRGFPRRARSGRSRMYHGCRAPFRALAGGQAAGCAA